MEELCRIPQNDDWSKSQSQTLIRVKNLSASWSDDKEKLVLDNVSFEVDQVLMIL